MSFIKSEVDAAFIEDRSRHHDHGRVDEPGSVHGGKHVPQFVTQVLQGEVNPVGWVFLLIFTHAMLHQRGVQIDHMRHHGCAQHAHGNVDALRVDFGDQHAVQ